MSSQIWAQFYFLNTILFFIYLRIYYFLGNIRNFSPCIKAWNSVATEKKKKEWGRVGKKEKQRIVLCIVI